VKFHVSDKVSQTFPYLYWQPVNLLQGPSHNLHCPYHGSSYTKIKYPARVIYEFTTFPACSCSTCFAPFAAKAFSNAAAPSLSLLSLIFAYLAVMVLVV
jgi:hypothetical protein